MQFQSDILGVPVEVPHIPESTALGAAFLAGLATGFWASREELAATWKLEHRYESVIPTAERDRLYRRWKVALKRARGWAREDWAVED